MKILLVNQTFYPDVASTAQHAGDLAVQLAEAGHDVTVVSGRRAYDNPKRTFPRSESWRGVKIHRIDSLGLGKASKWRRALDFAFFLLSCAFKLLFLPKSDVVIAMTSPPLVAFVASLYSSCKGAALVYWVMDMNPDEAIAAGWLRQNSVAGRLLGWISGYTFRHSDSVVVLDRFMQSRVLQKGVDPGVIHIIPPWSHDDAVQVDSAGRDGFRREHGLEGKFVVMYSGNHSPCHPLDTLMEAAKQLADRPGIVFCFIGGGSEHARVREFAKIHNLRNINCLPYQPIARLSASLDSADMHAVVMGDPFVGIVHPCKIYNVLHLGKLVLYIGPSQGHIPDMISTVPASGWFYHAAHADVHTTVNHILSAAEKSVPDGQEQRQIARGFSAGALLPQLAALIESTAPNAASLVKSPA